MFLIFLNFHQNLSNHLSNLFLILRVLTKEIFFRKSYTTNINLDFYGTVIQRYGLSTQNNIFIRRFHVSPIQFDTYASFWFLLSVLLGPLDSTIDFTSHFMKGHPPGQPSLSIVIFSTQIPLSFLWDSNGVFLGSWSLNVRKRLERKVIL